MIQERDSMWRHPVPLPPMTGAVPSDPNVPQCKAAESALSAGPSPALPLPIVNVEIDDQWMLLL